ncbi:MAG: hypothetical protein QNJ68_12875 [Microcoleaceae cyanobacterium MO_207.B10]|nr:hypothetical protein [Microcoleaceae cyanobacterium MO_207.B10]
MAAKKSSQSHIYNRTIWMYWQNKPGYKRPEYLDLCLQTIQKHNPDFEINIAFPKNSEVQNSFLLGSRE